jgi:lysophospholipase L1-like esterase
MRPQPAPRRRSPSRWLPRLLLLALLALPATFAGAAGAAGAPRFDPPKRYDLVLGDSLAFGYQDAKFKAELTSGTYNPADFTGYWAPFAARLAAIRPGIQTVDLACPGETTTTFLAGGCLFHEFLPLHADYPSAEPQLQAALAFLGAHRGQVSPITVSLGANDLLQLVDACEAEHPGDAAAIVACTNAGLPATLATVRANLDGALAALRAAAPESEIIVLQPYNPYVALLPGLTPGVQALDAVIAQAAAGARARPADGFSAVTSATVCTLTLLCTPDGDIHPSDAGYQVLAAALWAASGYDRLVPDAAGP